MNFYLYIGDFEVFPKKSVFWSYLYVGLSRSRTTRGITSVIYGALSRIDGDFTIIKSKVMKKLFHIYSALSRPKLYEFFEFIYFKYL